MCLKKVEEHYLPPVSRAYKILERKSRKDALWYENMNYSFDTRIELRKVGGEIRLLANVSTYIEADNEQYYPAGIHTFCSIKPIDEMAEGSFYLSSTHIGEGLILVLKPYKPFEGTADGEQICSKVWELDDAYIKKGKIKKRYLGFFKVTVAYDFRFGPDFHILDVWFYEDSVTQMKAAVKAFIEAISMPFTTVGILKVIDMEKKDLLVYIVTGRTFRKIK